MRDGPACLWQWSDVPPSGHCFFLARKQTLPILATVPAALSRCLGQEVPTPLAASGGPRWPTLAHGPRGQAESKGTSSGKAVGDVGKRGAAAGGGPIGTSSPMAAAKATRASRALRHTFFHVRFSHFPGPRNPWKPLKTGLFYFVQLAPRRPSCMKYPALGSFRRVAGRKNG